VAVGPSVGWGRAQLRWRVDPPARSPE